MKLNPNQQQAVDHGSGPLLIIAGAGTGKTTVITKRIQHLIKDNQVDPQHIFATTFTQKSAEDMLARLDQVMPLGYRQPWIGTFHSLCDRLLRVEGLEVGLDPSFTVMTQTDQWIFIKEHLFDFDLNYYRPLGNPAKFITALIKFFSRIQDETISAEEFGKFSFDQSQKANSDEEKIAAKRLVELSQSHKTYQQLKIEHSVMDFGDLINKTIELFQTRPNLLKNYQNQFQHILVDEFQDTNLAQYSLIKLMAPSANKPNLVVVGDDDQCLPGDAKIITPSGFVGIKKIKPGDQILSAAGKGYTNFAKVSRVFKNTSQRQLITFTTKSGKSITVTDNHKMFCHIENHPVKKDITYVYLMHQQNLGWRIGTTSDLPARLRLERHIDSILAIKACLSEEEARYYETLYSLRYGIPTTAFSARPNQTIRDKWLEKLLSEIDTHKSAIALAKDINIDITQPLIYSGGINRDSAQRINVYIYMCHRNYTSRYHKQGLLKNPSIRHLLRVETSNKRAITLLEQAGYNLTPAKKGSRLRIQSSNLQSLLNIGKKISSLLNGNLVYCSSISRKNTQTVTSRIVPAKNVFPGTYLPVLRNNQLVNDRIISRNETIKSLATYDLEVENNHNFIADDIAVHNSIYKFRGASVANILHFKQDYPTAKNVVLTQNYRSTQEILDSSYHSIVHNNPDRLEVQLDIDKKLHSQTKSKTKPSVIQFDHSDDEVKWTIDQIIKLASSEGISYHDIAILTRSNSQLEPYANALRRSGIPYQLIANRGLFDQAEIRSLIYFLKTIVDPLDDQILFQFSQTHIFDLSQSLLLEFMRSSKIHSTSMWQQMQSSDDENISTFVDLIKKYQSQIKTQTVTQILYDFVSSNQYLQPFISQESVENQLKIKNLNLFFEKLKSYELTSDNTQAVAFFNTLDLWLDAGENPGQAQIEDIDTVSLMTIHAAKGLEFSAVFIGSLVAGRFPSSNRKDPIVVPEDLIKETLPQGDIHIQEERRLFYVALTRAKKYLYLTLSIDYGGKKKWKPSGFIAETDLKIESPAVSDQLPLISTTTSPTPTYLKSGQYQINHLSYSQIDTFKLCPLKYKYRYLLQIPAKPHHSLSFGRTIHQTLDQFHQHQIQGQALTEEKLIDLYQKNFIDEGYDSIQHKKARYKAGIDAMKNYYQQYQQLFGEPEMLEQSFKMKFEDITFSGKIDRIDINGDGDYQIIDYKTGSHKDQKKVDKDDQLTLYGLAARDILGLDIRQMSLYFLEDGGKKVTTTRTSAQLDKAKQKLTKDINSIKSSKFTATPNSFKCGFCEYNQLCPFAAKTNK